MLLLSDQPNLQQRLSVEPILRLSLLTLPIFVPQLVPQHGSFPIFVPQLVAQHGSVPIFVPQLAPQHGSFPIFEPQRVPKHGSVPIFEPQRVAKHGSVPISEPQRVPKHGFLLIFVPERVPQLISVPNPLKPISVTQPSQKLINVPQQPSPQLVFESQQFLEQPVPQLLRFILVPCSI